MTNYKQLLTYFSQIAYNHKQVRSFGFGDVTQITMDIQGKTEPQYPRVYVIPNDVTMAQGHITYKFSIIAMDKLASDYSNQPDVLSDMLEISKDIFTALYWSYTQTAGDFSYVENPVFDCTTTPFLEKYETVLAGFTTNITLDIPHDYNRCDLPIIDFTDTTANNWIKALPNWNVDGIAWSKE